MGFGWKRLNKIGMNHPRSQERPTVMDTLCSAIAYTRRTLSDVVQNDVVQNDAVQKRMLCSIKYPNLKFLRSELPIGAD